MSGILYIVATPIGNLQDLSLRAINTLKEADLILAEDTRQTKVLLSHYEIDRPILSYHHHSSEARRAEIAGELAEGKDLALVTDAGTPGISDPGNELIEYLLGQIPELRVVPIPGASAVSTALSVSGFDVSKFTFLGFMPKKKRKKHVSWAQEGGVAFCYFDSPYRVVKNLELLIELLGGGRRVCVCRELTKMHEIIYRGTLQEVRDTLAKERLRGEFVVVVEGD